MKLKAFRVQMYRCFLDSAWIDLHPLTVLVGKNEAGKTSLLRALHKFNPFKPEPYSLNSEWPRGHRKKRNEAQVVCSARFALSAEEKANLGTITDQGVEELTELEVSKDYAGRFEVVFPLDRLEASATDNTLIYSTHLPFMIDVRKPDRIRVLSEARGNGVIVTDDLTQSQPEGKFVLQAALGMSGSTRYLVAERNLVVEGVDDFWILTELSRLLKKAGEPCLPDDVLITPAGGAAEAGYIATFMIGQKLKVVVLLDSDRVGSDAKEKLVKRWLTRYHSTPPRFEPGRLCGEA